MEAVTTDERERPFEYLEHLSGTWLYTLMISDFMLNMRVYRTEEFGYLWFFIREPNVIPVYGGSRTELIDEIPHFSLYRVSLGDLEGIERFADRLQRRTVVYTYSPAPAQ